VCFLGSHLEIELQCRGWELCRVWTHWVYGSRDRGLQDNLERKRTPTVHETGAGGKYMNDKRYGSKER